MATNKARHGKAIFGGHLGKVLWTKPIFKPVQEIDLSNTYMAFGSSQLTKNLVRVFTSQNQQVVVICVVISISFIRQSPYLNLA